mmetsp:Transcript_375/g.326  ORF Transcript_375/g.326 Transcript_375/m.326 type:complete len:107 (-) Transcript_375:2940-3260(-)
MGAVLTFYTLQFVFMVVAFIICVKHNLPVLVEPIILSVYLRNVFIFFDLEQRILYQSQFQLAMTQVVTILTVVFMQIILYLSLKNINHIPLIMITSVMLSLGCLIY